MLEVEVREILRNKKKLFGLKIVTESGANTVLISQDMSSVCPQGCLGRVGAEATRCASFVQRAGVAQVSAVSSF